MQVHIRDSYDCYFVREPEVLNIDLDTYRYTRMITIELYVQYRYSTP